MIFEFNGCKPVIDPSSFVHPQANVTGKVVIGKNVYIGPGAVIRGDFGEIIIEDGTNVQENCVLHMFPGTKVLIKQNAHLGHGCIIHGAIVGENSLIGMNAVIMDDVNIGNECIIGALAFVPAEMNIPNRKLVVGNPAKVIKEVTQEMIDWKTKGTELYQKLPKECQISLKETTPLENISEQKPLIIPNYKTWKKSN